MLKCFARWLKPSIQWGCLLLMGVLPIAAMADSASPAVFQRQLIDHSAPVHTDDFLAPEQAFQVALDREGRDDFGQLKFTIAPGYYLYRDRIHLRYGGEEITAKAHFSAAEQKHDPAFGDVAVFQHQATIQLPALPTSTTSALELQYQGCAEAGLCYPPQYQRLALALNKPSSAASTSPQLTRSPSLSSTQGDTTSPSLAHQAALPAPLSLWTLVTLYGAGIGLTFTPCVLPMLPIACAIVVGQATVSRRKAFMLSLAYVTGMACAYAFLGALVGSFGSSLQLTAQLQKPMVLIPMAMICGVAALWLFDLVQFKLPTPLAGRIEHTQARLQKGGLIGTWGAGVLSTLVLSPCLSAPLAGLLVYLSASGRMINAIVGLVVLALGMGTPIMACCTFGSHVLPRSGAWMERVKQFFGLMLLAGAIWLLARILPCPLILFSWGTLGLGLAYLLGVGDGRQSGMAATAQIAGWAVALWSTACIFGAAAGHHHLLAPLMPSRSASPSASAPLTSLSATEWYTTTQATPLQQRLADALPNQLTVVDLYADWCTSCQRMEHELLAAAELAPLLGDVQRIRLDITAPDAMTQHFLREHGVIGPPGLLFFIGSHEAESQRIIGEPSLEQVKTTLETLLGHSQTKSKVVSP